MNGPIILQNAREQLADTIIQYRASRPAPLFMVGDGHQRINRKIPIPLSRAGINVVGRSRRLKINYRTSAQIRAWAQSLLAGMDIDDLDGGKADTTGDRSVFKGPEPSARRATSIEQAASMIADWASELVEKEGLGSHEICVAPVRDAVKSALAAKGIGFLELEARRVDPGKAEPGVRLGSIRRIKGLEFKAVAMIIDQSARSSEQAGEIRGGDTGAPTTADNRAFQG